MSKKLHLQEIILTYSKVQMIRVVCPCAYMDNEKGGTRVLIPSCESLAGPEP